MELISLFGIQFIFYLLTFFLKKGNLIKKRNILLAIGQVVIFYTSILVIVKIVGEQLERKLYSFDLNGDGFFSGDEINPAQEAAMQAFIADTGRTFAPITGAFFSLFYLPVAIGIEFFIDFVVGKLHYKK